MLEMKLYVVAISGNCYKVRFMLAVHGLDYETAPVGLRADEQQSPEHLARNPLGKLPVLEGNGTGTRDFQAILVYLARRQSATDWLSEMAAELARVMFAANETLNGPTIASGLVKFNRESNRAGIQERARQALAVLEARLEIRDWLARDRPTIADIAPYPYAGWVWEGDVSLEPYTALTARFKRWKPFPDKSAWRVSATERLPAPLPCHGRSRLRLYNQLHGETKIRPCS